MASPNQPHQREGERRGGYHGGGQGGGGFRGGGGRDEHGPSAALRDLLPRINLAELEADLFDKTAERAAHEVASGKKEANKPAQIRRFFDELCMWESKVAQNPDRFGDYLPFIRMMNAKVAYAFGRKLVDDNFRALFQRCAEQIVDDKTLRHAKLFFEAFLGFYKVEKRD
jgi:CRISPR-associated protein Csm2